MIRLVCVVAAAALMGCQAGPALEGRVVEGPASVVVPVDAGDPRLGAGARPVEGATVTVRARRADGPVLATATTDADGRYRAALPGRGDGRSELAVAATAPEHLAARSVLFLPERGRRVLVVLERIGGSDRAPAANR